MGSLFTPGQQMGLTETRCHGLALHARTAEGLTKKRTGCHGFSLHTRGRLAVLGAVELGTCCFHAPQYLLLRGSLSASLALLLTYFGTSSHSPGRLSKKRRHLEKRWRRRSGKEESPSGTLRGSRAHPGQGVLGRNCRYCGGHCTRRVVISNTSGHNRPVTHGCGLHQLELLEGRNRS